MAVSFSSFLKKLPSNEFIRTIEKTKVMLIPFSVFEHMQREHPSIMQINFDVLVDYSQWLEKRLFHLQFHTAKERYQILLNSQPELIKKNTLDVYSIIPWHHHGNTQSYSFPNYLTFIKCYHNLAVYLCTINN